MQNKLIMLKLTLRVNINMLLADACSIAAEAQHQNPTNARTSRANRKLKRMGYVHLKLL